jgi:hypothetical protein
MASHVQSALEGSETPFRELQWAVKSLSANVLVVGVRESIVSRIASRGIDGSNTVLSGGVPLAGLAGTYVIANAVVLTRDQQSALCRRIDAEPRIRLLTVSPTSLYPLVLAGSFDETLFYRLNTVTVDFTRQE